MFLIITYYYFSFLFISFVSLRPIHYGVWKALLFQCTFRRDSHRNANMCAQNPTNPLPVYNRLNTYETLLPHPGQRPKIFKADVA